MPRPEDLPSKRLQVGDNAAKALIVVICSTGKKSCVRIRTRSLCLLLMQPSWLHQGWMHAKLGFVAALLAYHLFCYRLMGQLHAGTCQWSGKQLRALNELPTLLLVIVVMLVVFKTQFPTSAATWFIVALVVFMAASVSYTHLTLPTILLV